MVPPPPSLCRQVEGAPRSCEQATNSRRGWLMGQLAPLVPATRVCDGEGTGQARQLGEGQTGRNGHASGVRRLQSRDSGQSDAGGQSTKQDEISDVPDMLSTLTNVSTVGDAPPNAVVVRFLVAQMKDTLYGVLLILGVLVLAHYLVLLLWASCRNRHYARWERGRKQQYVDAGHDGVPPGKQGSSPAAQVASQPPTAAEAQPAVMPGATCPSIQRSTGSHGDHDGGALLKTDGSAPEAFRRHAQSITQQDTAEHTYRNAPRRLTLGPKTAIKACLTHKSPFPTQLPTYSHRRNTLEQVARPMSAQFGACTMKTNPEAFAPSFCFPFCTYSDGCTYSKGCTYSEGCTYSDGCTYSEGVLLFSCLVGRRSVVRVAPAAPHLSSPCHSMIDVQPGSTSHEDSSPPPSPPAEPKHDPPQETSNRHEVRPVRFVPLPTALVWPNAEVMMIVSFSSPLYVASRLNSHRQPAQALTAAPHH